MKGNESHGAGRAFDGQHDTAPLLLLGIFVLFFLFLV